MNLQRSGKFYDAVLGALGYGRVFENARTIGYAPRGERDDLFAIRQDEQSRPACSARFHLAFKAQSRDAVTQFYESAITNGATPDGEPGLHPEYGSGYFAAFVIDPDGYRIEAVLHELFSHE